MKKSIIVVVLCLFALPLWAQNPEKTIAGVNALDLFNALKVQPVLVQTDIPNYIMYTKTLSGLSCVYWAAANDQYGYGCTFRRGLDNFQLEEIYWNLNAVEYITESEDSYTKTFTKTVGYHTFSKSFLKLNENEFVTKYHFTMLEE